MGLKGEDSMGDKLNSSRGQLAQRENVRFVKIGFQRTVEGLSLSPKIFLHGTPNQMLNYKHAILLHELYNTNLHGTDWVDLNLQQIFKSCQTTYNIMKSNNFLVGNNLLSTRLSILNKKVDLNDLNLSLDTFKVKYKNKLLK